MGQHATNLRDLCEADRLTYLAHWRIETGDYSLAAAWLQRAVALKQLDQNLNQIEIADDFYSLGLLYRALNDEFNARRFLLKALQHQKKHLGSQHPDTLETMCAISQLPCCPESNLPEPAPQLFEPELSEKTAVLIPERRKVRNAC